MGAKDKQTVDALRGGRELARPLARHRLQPLHRARLRHGARRRPADASPWSRGVWPLFRYDPRRVARGEPPVVLDSGTGPAKARVVDYMRNEGRFRVVELQDPKRFARLARSAQEQAERRLVLLPPARRHPPAGPGRSENDALATRYLGLELAHPIVPGASPLADDIDEVLRLEDAGAPAIVMRSIFEEQIALEQMAAHRHMDVARRRRKRTACFPDTDVFALGLDSLPRAAPAHPRADVAQGHRVAQRRHPGRLDRLRPSPRGRGRPRAGAQPVLGSGRRAHVGGGSRGASSWPRCASVTRAVSLPVAVKLSPYYSSLPHLRAGASRTRARRPWSSSTGSTRPTSIPVRLEAAADAAPVDPRRAAAAPALAGHRLAADAPGAGGERRVSTPPVDAVKAIMAGAHVVQVVSTLLRHGASAAARAGRRPARFLEQEEYPSLERCAAT